VIARILGAARRVAPVALLTFMGALSVHAAPVPRFDAKAALEHVRKLSVGIGVRKGGTAAERRAADYIVARMASWGYTVTRQPVPLPNGLTSENLIFDKPGREPWTWIVGAHKDSKPPAPGANDNGSGVATLLELARDLRGAALAGGVRFIFFGAEEIQDPHHDDWHHFGSRWYVAHMSPEEKAHCGGMICIDSVGAGPWFVIGSINGDSPLEHDLRVIAHAQRVKVLEQTDPGWSDHQPFEDDGFAVAYVRWRIDPTLHTARDAFRHVQAWKIATAGRIVLDFLLHHDTRYPRRAD
jgi:hypothetical protein